MRESGGLATSHAASLSGEQSPIVHAARVFVTRRVLVCKHALMLMPRRDVNKPKLQRRFRGAFGEAVDRHRCTGDVEDSD